MQLPPLSEIQDALLYTVGLPLAAAAGTQLLFRLLLGKRASAAGSAVALAAGFAAANAHDTVISWFPGAYAHEWLPWVGLAALTASAVGGEGRSRASLWLAAVVFSLLWMLVPPEVRTASWWTVPVLALVVAGNWAVADEQARQTPGALVPFWLALVFLAAAVVLIHAHSKQYMDAAAILASSLLGVALASLGWSPDTGPVTGGASVFLTGLLLSGQTQTFSQVPCTSFVLIALSPLTLGVSLLPPICWLRPWPRVLLQTLMLLVPLTLAVFLALQNEKLDFSF
jgi:hypothetical protein